MKNNPVICVVGLGYVGLPLLVEFGKKFSVLGFDVSSQKILDLKGNMDRTGEILSSDMESSDFECSDDPSIISRADFIIIAVPTPITEDKKPDMSYLVSSSEIVGKNMKKGSIVVYESTVYPGATEEVCLPVLEKESAMRCGRDFWIGYSPERINPGDKEHTVGKIIKVVSGMDKRTLDRVAEVYGMIISAGVHRASSIKVAEAAKVIENIQRDLNIALMNELSLIFDRLGIPTKEVIDAAGTKWNFHKYHPGLVGGHCIGVDPYYLTYKAQALGYQPQIILAGRNINEYMSKHVADKVVKGLSRNGKALDKCKVVIFGLTFKENVPDYRNSKAKDVISELKKYNLDIYACEPLLDANLVKANFGVPNISWRESSVNFDCAVFINPHREFADLTLERLRSVMSQKPLLVDIRNWFDRKQAEGLGFEYDSL